jgi:hypothetical protein
MSVSEAAAVAPPVEAPASESKRARIWQQVMDEDAPTTSAAAAQRADGGAVKLKFLSGAHARFIVPVIVFILCALILVLLSPPIAMQKPKDDVASSKRSVPKILAWSGLAAALALVLPPCIAWARRSKQQQQ